MDSEPLSISTSLSVLGQASGTWNIKDLSLILMVTPIFSPAIPVRIMERNCLREEDFHMEMTSCGDVLTFKIIRGTLWSDEDLEGEKEQSDDPLMMKLDISIPGFNPDADPESKEDEEGARQKIIRFRTSKQFVMSGGISQPIPKDLKVKFELSVVEISH